MIASDKDTSPSLDNRYTPDGRRIWWEFHSPSHRPHTDDDAWVKEDSERETRRFHAARKRAGLTQKQVADRAGTSLYKVRRAEVNIGSIELTLFFALFEAVGDPMCMRIQDARTHD